MIYGPPPHDPVTAVRNPFARKFRALILDMAERLNRLSDNEEGLVRLLQMTFEEHEPLPVPGEILSSTPSEAGPNQWAYTIGACDQFWQLIEGAMEFTYENVLNIRELANTASVVNNGQLLQVGDATFTASPLGNGAKVLVYVNFFDGENQGFYYINEPIPINDVECEEPEE